MDVWLVEWTNPPFSPSTPIYFVNWPLISTRNPHEAMRFARREDAQKVVDSIMYAYCWKPVEHRFE